MIIENICGLKPPRMIRNSLINESPGQYCMSFDFESSALAESIKRTGLINPIIVTKGKERYDIVAGYRRFKALNDLQKHDICCIDLSVSGLSPFDMLILNLHDNLSTRVFNEVEKGMILNRLSAYVSRETIIKDFMPLLNIGNRNDIDLFLKIDGMDNRVKYALARGTISLKALKLMMELDDDSQEALLSLLERIKTNSNYQCHLAEHLIDISGREGISVSEILKEKQYKSILSDEKTNNPQKVKNLINLIWSRRYPNLSNSLRQFRKDISRLNLPDKVRIDSPPFFEAHDYRLELLFRDGDELLEKLESLLKRQDKIRGLRDPW